ncbi:hypothetical protein [Mucilaginibacter myungsuensis]|uniref:Lipoprotein n=1 Tax=Mucilaginibacter myungsuensis TaxID=649104 RepID=A0A929L0F9_9SPHI|nr:hypothetical protein [Mucilaginibacter myungsuensis]MBE9664542.1 hypothetical protein [Mucilaginibacter myungsuensis]MDN3601108.1 hypothetical protein [Mucilaginibacter myungsuensis]
MKKIFTLLCFAPFIAMLAAGCVKKPDENAAQLIIPYGNFKGQFMRVHYSRTTKKYDTVRCNLELSLDAYLKKFKVTGDTTTVHAGSYGTYTIDEFYIGFNDFTMATADGKKAHLTSGYRYGYDGDILKIQAVQDTLGFYYNLRYSKL